MAWMQKYTEEVFDVWNVMSDKSKFEPYHTSDFTYVHTDGIEYSGFEKAHAACVELYGPFQAGFAHVPRFWTCWENDDGKWEMVGDATMFANLPDGTGGEKIHADNDGKKWDLALSSMFHFWYVKESSAPDGFKLKRTEVYADTFPAVQEMMKRGMIKQ